MIAALEQTPNLTIIEQMAVEIIVENGRVVGVRCKDGPGIYSITMSMRKTLPSRTSWASADGMTPPSISFVFLPG